MPKKQSDAQKMLENLTPNEGFVRRTLLPESYYVARLNVIGDVKPSRVKGTPGMDLILSITQGPFTGSEVAVQQWFSGKMIDLLKHLVIQITGNAPNAAVLDEYNMVFDPNQDFKEQLATQFDALDPDQKCDLMQRLCFTDQWDGKTVVVQLGIEDREFIGKDGDQVSFQQQRLLSVFALNHGKKGQAYVAKVAHPAQVEAKAFMEAMETPDEVVA